MTNRLNTIEKHRQEDLGRLAQLMVRQEITHDEYLRRCAVIHNTYDEMTAETFNVQAENQGVNANKNVVSLQITRGDGVRFNYDRFSPNGTEVNFLTAHNDVWASVPVGRFNTALEALAASETFVMPEPPPRRVVA